LVVVCLFLANDIAWALPDGYSKSLQTSSSTLAAELRTKPFFDEHLPGFRNQWELLSVIGRLKKMFDAGPVRSSHIVSLNDELKNKLRGEAVEIGENIEFDKLPSSGIRN
jgi:hypothetical protein